MENSRIIHTNEVADPFIRVDLARSRFEAGYWRGMRQPAFIFDVCILVGEIRQSTLDQYDEITEALLRNRQPHRLPKIVAEHPILARLASTSLDILSTAGMPIMAGVQARQIRRGAQIHWMLGLPAIDVGIAAPRRAIGWAAQLFNSLTDGREIALASLSEDFYKLIKSCARKAPTGVNTLRFLQAAHDECIPWRHVANNVYQFGWGSKARWLDSSFTDETSGISAGLARDKFACAKVLRDAGLPVPRHRQVANEQQAVAAAERLGYPVVLKPTDLDGGKGVYTQLRSPEAVRKAFSAASSLSDRILVEQHVEGHDYRLQVYKGEVIWAMHRRPAYVIGNGTETVEDLIRRANLDRKSRPSDHLAEQARKPITIDDEVRDWLGSQGLTLKSIPLPGQNVRLRGPANINVGGTREAVLDKVHPDNLELASRAASVLRLDLAGIDLLIPDISRPWHETGGAICEVNAQPQLSRHLHRAILPRLVPRRGRIPTIVLIGSVEAHRDIREELVAKTISKNICVGWVDSHDVYIGNKVSRLAGGDAFAGCRALLADPRVDALVLQISELPMKSNGLPIDRVDVAVLLPESPGESRNDRAMANDRWTPEELANQVFTLSGTSNVEQGHFSLGDLPDQLIKLVTKNIPINDDGSRIFE